MKRIFVIGQCTLHWGRMEYGNIGNYYIAEPFFREIHRVFPNAEIVTTFQMTDDFNNRENVKKVPMDLYYGWKDDDLDIARKEYEIAKEYNRTGILNETTPYIDEVLKSDLVIDFSGDIWGRNADFVGKDRFLTGLYKDRVAQLLNKKTAMISGSPGPFDETLIDFIKETYANFDLVTHREYISQNLLKALDFDLSKTKVFPCPSVLFKESEQKDIIKYIENTPLVNKEKPVIGFILCGWNIEQGPYSREVYYERDFEKFIELLKYCTNTLNAQICLISHSNGFDLPPNFKLKGGRDYTLLSQFYNFIKKYDFAKDVFFLDGVYLPSETKAIIKNFDMLISGRLHGAVGGLTTFVPTVIIDYGHEPKAHKLQGLSQIFEIEKYLANPASADDMIEKCSKCFNNRLNEKEKLLNLVPKIQERARANFDCLKEF